VTPVTFPPGPTQCRDKTCSDGINSILKNDRYGCRCNLRRKCGRCAAGKKHFHFAPNEFRRECRKAVVTPLRPAIFDGRIPTLHIATFFQAFQDRSCVICGARTCAKKADHRHRRLLCPRRLRPCRRAAEPCDELAPFSFDHLVGEREQEVEDAEAFANRFAVICSELAEASSPRWQPFRLSGCAHLRMFSKSRKFF
jgi:hypothetical protein